MAASLAALVEAEWAIDAAAVDLAIRRLTLAHALVLGWGGIPVLWMGDEVGLPSDPDWAAEPGHAGDNRWLHRPPMDPERLAQRHDPATVAGRLFAAIRHLAVARSGLVQLHAAPPRMRSSPTIPMCCSSTASSRRAICCRSTT